MESKTDSAWVFSTVPSSLLNSLLYVWMERSAKHFCVANISTYLFMEVCTLNLLLLVLVPQFPDDKDESYCHEISQPIYMAIG